MKRYKPKYKESSNIQIANTILAQLGGNKFIAMTGSTNFLAIPNGISMHLKKNRSGAKYLNITLNGKDLYDMEFSKITIKKIGAFIRDEKLVTVKTIKDVFNDQLQEIFQSVTGFRTQL